MKRLQRFLFSYTFIVHFLLLILTLIVSYYRLSFIVWPCHLYVRPWRRKAVPFEILVIQSSVIGLFTSDASHLVNDKSCLQGKSVLGNISWQSRLFCTATFRVNAFERELSVSPLKAVIDCFIKSNPHINLLSKVRSPVMCHPSNCLWQQAQLVTNGRKV